jgi:large subunit ribosomal protein L21
MPHPGLDEGAVGYAIIATGGKQHKVSVGDRLRVESLQAVVGDSVTFDQVLALQDGAELKVGRPRLDGARVVAKVVEQGKFGKILVFKKKRRKQYRRTRGHRQPFTEVVVEEIHAD